MITIPSKDNILLNFNSDYWEEQSVNDILSKTLPKSELRNLYFQYILQQNL